MVENLLPGLAALISVALAVIVQLMNYHRLRKKRAVRKEVPPGERFQESISKLSSASQEINMIIQDIVQDIDKRQSALEQLKERHQVLSQEEQELSKKVKMLKDVPLEVANYFQQISQETIQQVERKRARRDVVMFILGILVTTVVAILLRGV
jgi:septal ring factor EnvC (AmiA/AmiB activator)